MMDYLSAIAERTAAPISEVRPLHQPAAADWLGAVPGVDTNAGDDEFYESQPIHADREPTRLEAEPSPLRSAKTTNSQELEVKSVPPQVINLFQANLHSVVERHEVSVETPSLSTQPVRDRKFDDLSVQPNKPNTLSAEQNPTIQPAHIQPLSRDLPQGEAKKRSEALEQRVTKENQRLQSNTKVAQADSTIEPIRRIQTQESKERTEAHSRVPRAQESSSDTLPRKHLNAIVPLSSLPQLPQAWGKALQPEGSVPSRVTETVVHVTIGRVDVRAVVGSSKTTTTRETPSRSSSQNLENYLSGGYSRRPT